MDEVRSFERGKSSQARAPPQQAPTPTTFEANFRSDEEWAKFERAYAKQKIQEICTI